MKEDESGDAGRESKNAWRDHTTSGSLLGSHKPLCEASPAPSRRRGGAAPAKPLVVGTRSRCVGLFGVRVAVESRAR